MGLQPVARINPAHCYDAFGVEASLIGLGRVDPVKAEGRIADHHPIAINDARGSAHG
jgi:hypothetical protein